MSQMEDKIPNVTTQEKESKFKEPELRSKYTLHLMPGEQSYNISGAIDYWILFLSDMKDKGYKNYMIDFEAKCIKFSEEEFYDSNLTISKSNVH